MKRKILISVLILLLVLLTLIISNSIWIKIRYKAKTRISAKSRLNFFWKNAQKEIYKSGIDILMQNQDEIKKGLHYNKFIRGNKKLRQIALTFDDGPHPDYTKKILAILKQNNIRATFFVVGEMAEKYPELVSAEVFAGCNIGNHTFDHVAMTKLSSLDAATEIMACGDIIQSITGVRPHLFRPPGGDYNDSTAMIAGALGYTMVLWTDNAGDWSSPGEKFIELKILWFISNGGIILMHDGIQQTIDILPKLIRLLKERGYEFVTIDEMIMNK